MGHFKKRLSSVLAILLVAMTCSSYLPVKATETIPKITFVGVEHSPLVVGDTETFYLSSDGIEEVQYRIFQNKIGTDKWEELTTGYTNAENANSITTVNGTTKYEAGKYKLSVWVKKADTEGIFKNKNGSYDSYHVAYLNCVNKDNNNRVYTDGDMNLEKDNYMVGETVKVDGISGISGMKAPYTYKLHVYDVNNNVWSLDKADYRDKEELTWIPNKPGTYVLDVWAMSSNSTLWAKEAMLNGRIYEGWKLKVITVKEKVETLEINIVEKGQIYGSQDEKNPMEISKNVNITADDVVLNNVNVKGNVTITGDNATLNNVKIQGTLILNPGEKGHLSVNNLTADTIEVLSGAANSIHFNNVNSKVLNVNSKNVKESVRIELKGKTNIGRTEVKSSVILEATEGSFGNVEVLENQNKTESLLDLRGTFEKDITVKTNATLKTAKDAKVSKVVIEPANNEKITLDGNFDKVVVNKPSTVVITPNTTIVELTTNCPTILELGAGSVITTLDKNGQVVTQTGPGKIEKVVNPPVTPGSGSWPGPTPEPTYNVTGVSLNKNIASLMVGDPLELIATINPSNATNKNVTWSSTNQDVATVTGTGTTANVATVSTGSAIILVTTEDGRYTAACEITVLSDLGATVNVEGKKVDVLVNNDKVANQQVTITMHNKANELVFMDQLTADSEGIGTFSTTLEEGEYTCVVKAAEAYLISNLEFKVEIIKVGSVKLNETDINTTTGQAIQLTATIYPDNATNKELTWTSDNPEVATVTGSGINATVTTGTTTGSAIILVTTEDGNTASCTITVLSPELGATVTVKENKVDVLVKNDKIANQQITITMHNKANEVVFMDQLTADSQGIAKFNTVLEAGEYYGVVKAYGAYLTLITDLEFNVVFVKVESVSLDQTEINMTTGQSIQLTATINPSNATKQKVTWTSDNPDVATVKLTETNGVVFIEAGTTTGSAIIFATTEDGHSASCIITVSATTSAAIKLDVTKLTVTLDKADGKLNIGELLELIATLNPSDVPNQKVIWTSSDGAVATVTGSTGTKANVKAIGAGTATITVTTEDGKETATFEVIVVEALVKEEQ